jgi:coenzyme PQQ synthesis protein D (PqqD)
MDEAMDRSTVFVKNHDAVYRIYDGEAVVVLPGEAGEAAERRHLNRIGTLVWDRIDGRTTLGDLIEAVVQEYEVTPEEAERDILEFIASLREQKMVR